jgi:SulP family sulfate permease
MLAGLVASLVIIAHCLSFSALIFHGDLKSGLSPGLWAFLAGAAITSLIVALTTTLPPAIAGPRNPAVAVMSVLAATVAAQVAAAGGSAESAATHVLLALSIATLLTGIVLYLVAVFHLGQIVRFVPYPVVGGFLAASGWLLLVGGIKVVGGANLATASLLAAPPAGEAAKLAVAILFVLALLVLRRRVQTTLLLPAAFFGGALVLDAVLWSVGARGANSTWYLAGSKDLAPWLPVRVALAGGIDWAIFLRSAAELGAIVGVTLIALLLDVSSLEVTRSKVADLDVDFRANGLANILVAPLGGMSANLALNPSRLLDATGARTRASGVFGALCVGFVVLTGIDLSSLVPTPLLGGLLIYLGLVVLGEALLRSPAQRSLTELGLAFAIMFAIVAFGYLPGVVLGVIGACLMFAFNYSRIGVIRRHLTRAAHASNVVRAPEASELLRAQGDRIHVFWLSGFIFFGSSNGVFERIRKTVVGDAKVLRYVVLDVSGVTGFDTSAVLAFVKLRNWAREQGVVLAWAGLSAPLRQAFEQAGLLARDDVRQTFATRAEGLEWCEEQLLEATHPELTGGGLGAFEAWLGREIGEPEMRALVSRYLERSELAAGEMLYAQGGPSDTVDLVASGCVAVIVRDEDGRDLRVRRMAGHTVVGEMGFFRALPRAASVIAERPSIVYVMTRRAYEAMLAQEPELGARFLQFIVRALSERVEFANREIAALL